MDPGRLTRIFSLVGAISALLAGGLTGAPAAKVKPVACPAARYVVTQGADQIIGDVTPRPAFLAVQNGTVVLGSCNMSGPAPKAKKSGVTTLSAKAATCGTFSKVKLKAKIPSGCQTLSGTVKAKKLKAQTFQAKLSTCGDGVIDATGGEQCDGSLGCAGGTCDATCVCQGQSTTTTTIPASGHCTGSGTQCATADQCPAGQGCCGNGTRDFGETCDLGDSNCPTGQLCAAGCTSNCQAIGRCTGSEAQCLEASDCGAGQGCCGNRTQEAGESCDDGNLVNGDSCPATCHIDSCTPDPASGFGAHVTWTGPAGTIVAGLGIFVDYPEGKVGQLAVTNAFGVSGTPNDLSYGFTDAVIKGSGLPKPMLTLSFKTCQGAGAAVAGDFSCVVTDASDDQGNVLDLSTLSCSVTVP